MKTGAHQGRRWCSPSTRRRSSAWAPPAASSSTSRTAATAAPSELAEVTQPVPRRGATGPAARRACRRCGAPTCRSSTSTSTARRRRRSACRSTSSSTRSPATLGSYYVNDFNKFGRTWQVLMSAEPAYRNRPDDIGEIYVRSRRRARWFRSTSLATVRYSVRPRLARPLQQPAGGEDLRPGRAGRVSSGQAIAARSSSIADEGAAAGLQLRLGRRLVPGEALGRHLGPRARPRGRHGVPDPRRAVREVVAAALGAAGAAVRHVRRARGDLAARA